jgi:phosphopantetheinyl transferase (holo-ACP synthase)
MAYSKECRVGVDLEFHSRNRLKLADRFYSAVEVERIHHLQASEGEDSALRHFYTLWCRKEAFYKCHGGDFFEGTLRRDMRSGLVEGVSLLDLNPKDYGIQGECSLCLATKPLAGV